jgi:hypothetical protein
MDDRVSPEFILAAIGDVGASGLHFLLRSPPEKISGGNFARLGRVIATWVHACCLWERSDL